jgi:oligosaccharide repeat unit polymerase
MELVFLLSIFVGGLAFMLLAVKKPFDAPFTYIMHIVFLMAPPAFFHAIGFRLPTPILQYMDTDRANLTLAMCLLLSLAGTIVGLRTFRLSAIGNFILPDFSKNRSRIVSFVGIMALTLLGFIVILPAFAQAGFNPFRTIELIRIDGFFYGGGGTLRYFAFFAFFLSGVFLITLFKDRKDGHPTSRSMILFMIGVFCFNMFMNILLGGKTFVIFPLAFTILAYEICVRRKGYRRIVFALLIIASATVSLQFVRTAFVGKFNVEQVELLYRSLYFSVYDTTLLYVDTHNDLHFTETGEDFANSFTLLVPRALWENKPDSMLTAGNRFSRQIFPGKDNPGGWPPYGFAQWYVNFGWLGVFMGGVLTGWVLSLLQQKYSNFRDEPFAFFTMQLLVLVVMGPWPGGIHNVSIMNFVLYILPIFIFKWLTTRSLYDISEQSPKN